MMIRIFVVVSIFLITVLNADNVKLKNLYILIEPTSVENSIYKNKEYNPIIDNSIYVADKIIKWVCKESSRPKFKNLIINGKVFKKDQIKYADLKLYLKKIVGKKKLLKNRGCHKYNIAKILGNLHNEFVDEKWKGEDSLLVVIGDINYVSHGISSHGKYLNSAWLQHKKSSFVQKFINKDNEVMKDTSVVLITRTQLKINNEQKRKDFLINLFAKANMKTFYVGNSLKNVKIGQNQNTFIIEILNKIRTKVLDTLKVKKLKNIPMCQIISDTETVTIKNCGGI